MLRKNPDAFALVAITLVVAAVTAIRLPVRPPQPRWVVTPIRAELLAHRQCIRDTVRQSVHEATRTITQTFRRRY